MSPAHTGLAPRSPLAEIASRDPGYFGSIPVVSLLCGPLQSLVQCVCRSGLWGGPAAAELSPAHVCFASMFTALVLGLSGLLIPCCLCSFREVDWRGGGGGVDEASVLGQRKAVIVLSLTQPAFTWTFALHGAA